MGDMILEAAAEYTSIRNLGLTDALPCLRQSIDAGELWLAGGGVCRDGLLALASRVVSYIHQVRRALGISCTGIPASPQLADLDALRRAHPSISIICLAVEGAAAVADRAANPAATFILLLELTIALEVAVAPADAELAGRLANSLTPVGATAPLAPALPHKAEVARPLTAGALLAQLHTLTGKRYAPVHAQPPHRGMLPPRYRLTSRRHGRGSGSETAASLVDDGGGSSAAPKHGGGGGK